MDRGTSSTSLDLAQFVNQVVFRAVLETFVSKSVISDEEFMLDTYFKSLMKPCPWPFFGSQ
jgi:hypothetical protein